MGRLLPDAARLERASPLRTASSLLQLVDRRADLLESVPGGVMAHWKNRGYSDDWIITAVARKQRRRIANPPLLFLNLVDFRSPSQLYNFFHRQFFVLDTYPQPSPDEPRIHAHRLRLERRGNLPRHFPPPCSPALLSRLWPGRVLPWPTLKNLTRLTILELLDEAESRHPPPSSLRSRSLQA